MRRALSVLAASLIAALAPQVAKTQAPERLRLVHADAYSIIFMRDHAGNEGRPSQPFDIRTFTFFETPLLLGQVSEWDVRVSETRVDCQTGLLSDVRHQIFLNETPVDETTPPFRMQRPNGPAKAAIFAYACRSETVASDTLVDDLTAARIWATDAYQRMKTARP